MEVYQLEVAYSLEVAILGETQALSDYKYVSKYIDDYQYVRKYMYSNYCAYYAYICNAHALNSELSAYLICRESLHSRLPWNGYSSPG